ncbi:hypothetical protein C7441_11014 [Pseudaminobacter salicylatoxidans]|uniref:HK97 gp10 family phage protein n=1 Tax=Pseudaminobacter salicylatoxidans TaxID=93369 RepID=A0A316C0E3_PSESE|nr:hypothetical protein [Pseudaminobacter salicylatoxidans]PWJ81483.1 hypothetical protein C7441_11014 [Pseudaminobacter salicylatoxidans]
MSVQWFGDSILDKVRKAAMRGVIDGTESVIEEGNSMIMDGQKTGRIYRRRGVEHQASAPGEAPASDTGRLVQSARTEYEPADLSGEAIWSTDYAEDLEYGAANMAPRPFARPALANKKDAITAGIEGEIAAVLK